MKVLFAIVALFCLVSSKEIYVSQQRGDDSNSGTKFSPFRTFIRGHQAVEDGDTIYLEIGAYTFGQTVTKRIRVIGVREHQKYPIVNGAWIVESGSLYVQNLVLESPSSTLFTVKSKVEQFILTDFTITKTSSAAIDIPYCEGLVKINNGLIMNANTGIKISGCKTEGGLTISNIKMTDSETGLYIRESKGTITNATFININKKTDPRYGSAITILQKSDMKISRVTATNCTSQYGGAFYCDQSTLDINDSKFENNVAATSAGSLYFGNCQSRLRGVEMMNSKATNGGGFFCSSGSLNIFGGKIENNNAGNGGAGQCHNNCAFFQDGTIFRGNTQQQPSICQGIPNLRK